MSLPCQTVIARFAEDISWAYSLENVVVYNKGTLLGLPGEVRRPNKGLEEETYLYHIFKNYDDLAEITLFCQGRNEDHCPVQFPVARLFEMPDTAEVCGLFLCENLREWDDQGRLVHHGKWAQAVRDGQMKLCPYSFVSWWQKWVGLALPETRGIAYFPGAVFAVKRQAILRRSRDFYKKLLGQVSSHQNPEEAYFMERAWLYLWEVQPQAISYVAKR